MSFQCVDRFWLLSNGYFSDLGGCFVILAKFREILPTAFESVFYRDVLVEIGFTGMAVDCCRNEKRNSEIFGTQS